VARKGYDKLSSAYRDRLSKAGISRTDYNSGASLQAARGHAATPEHKGGKLTPKQQTVKVAKPIKQPGKKYIRSREQKDRDNARRRAKRYAELPATKRTEEWEQHQTEEALFWKKYVEYRDGTS
jgi:hypothetical protein